VGRGLINLMDRTKAICLLDRFEDLIQAGNFRAARELYDDIGLGTAGLEDQDSIFMLSFLRAKLAAGEGRYERVTCPRKRYHSAIQFIKHRSRPESPDLHLHLRPGPRLRGRRSVSQRTVGPDRIVLPPPLLKKHLSLPQGVEELAI